MLPNADYACNCNPDPYSQPYPSFGILVYSSFVLLRQLFRIVWYHLLVSSRPASQFLPMLDDIFTYRPGKPDMP